MGEKKRKEIVTIVAVLISCVIKKFVKWVNLWIQGQRLLLFLIISHSAFFHTLFKSVWDFFYDPIHFTCWDRLFFFYSLQLMQEKVVKSKPFGMKNVAFKTDWVIKLGYEKCF